MRPGFKFDRVAISCTTRHMDHEAAGRQVRSFGFNTLSTIVGPNWPVHLVTNDSRDNTLNSLRTFISAPASTLIFKRQIIKSCLKRVGHFHLNLESSLRALGSIGPEFH